MIDIRAIFIIFHKEIKAYFDSAIAYIFFVVFLMTTCGLYMNDFFLKGIVEMESYFIPLPYLMIFFLPALSMRLWAEERKDNTYELLMTLPIEAYTIVLGKFIASFFFFIITLFGTLPIIVMLTILGEPDYGRIITCYLGTFFLGAFYLSVGSFISSITKDQIVAYLLTILATFIFYFSGNELVVSIIDGLWPALQIGSIIRENFSVLPPFESFLRGIIDLRSIMHFSIIGLFFLWLNLHLVKKVR